MASVAEGSCPDYLKKIIYFVYIWSINVDCLSFTGSRRIRLLWSSGILSVNIQNYYRFIAATVQDLLRNFPSDYLVGSLLTHSRLTASRFIRSSIGNY